jgi:simple sugar transport system substrate-binding protein/basic membrane protein A
MKKIFIVFILLMVFSAAVLSFEVALMITGEVGGTPIYTMMVEGAKRSAQENGFGLKVVEGGHNPAKWEQTLISLVATMKYDVVVTFTEGMPKSVEKTAKMFPNQKIILIDGIAPAMDNVYSLAFKDEEMAYLAGAFAGLVTESKMAFANDEKKVALVAGDIYPGMTNKMKPAFEKGAGDIDEEIETAFVVAGTWADPNRGKDLAAALFSQGVDIVYGIAGYTSVGIVQEADEQNRYFIGTDSNTISNNPDVILACALKSADIAIEKVLTNAFKSRLDYGTSDRWGIKEGIIGFTFEDPEYLKNIPETIRNRMIEIYEALKEGEISPL